MIWSRLREAALAVTVLVLPSGNLRVTWRVALSIAVTLAVTVVEVAMVPVPGAEAAIMVVVVVGWFCASAGSVAAPISAAPRRVKDDFIELPACRGPELRERA